VALARYATGNLNWVPRKLGGGEDWFVIFRDFWMGRVAASCRLYYLRRKRKELVSQIAKTLGVARLPTIPGAEHLNLKHSLSFALLKGFAGTVLEQIHRPLKILYLSGEFYKEQNQQEFTDSFDAVSRLGNRIGKYERQFLPDGEIGNRILEARSDPNGVSARQRRLAEVSSDVDRAILQTVDSSIAQVHSLISVLTGVTTGKPGERYDTLSNLDTIGGGENRQLIAAWKRAAERIQEVWSLLCETRDVELAKH
jgi:hypothetical protein